MKIKPALLNRLTHIIQEELYNSNVEFKSTLRSRLANAYKAKHLHEGWIDHDSIFYDPSKNPGKKAQIVHRAHSKVGLSKFKFTSKYLKDVKEDVLQNNFRGDRDQQKQAIIDAFSTAYDKDPIVTRTGRFEPLSASEVLANKQKYLKLIQKANFLDLRKLVPRIIDTIIDNPQTRNRNVDLDFDAIFDREYRDITPEQGFLAAKNDFEEIVRNSEYTPDEQKAILRTFNDRLSSKSPESGPDPVLQAINYVVDRYDPQGSKYSENQVTMSDLLTGQSDTQTILSSEAADVLNVGKDELLNVLYNSSISDEIYEGYERIVDNLVSFTEIASVIDNLGNELGLHKTNTVLQGSDGDMSETIDSAASVAVVAKLKADFDYQRTNLINKRNTDKADRIQRVFLDTLNMLQSTKITSILRWINEYKYTSEQLSDKSKSAPVSYNTIHISTAGIIYTVLTSKVAAFKKGPTRNQFEDTIDSILSPRTISSFKAFDKWIETYLTDRSVNEWIKQGLEDLYEQSLQEAKLYWSEEYANKVSQLLSRKAFTDEINKFNTFESLVDFVESQFEENTKEEAQVSEVYKELEYFTVSLYKQALKDILETLLPQSSPVLEVANKSINSITDLQGVYDFIHKNRLFENPWTSESKRAITASIIQAGKLKLSSILYDKVRRSKFAAELFKAELAKIQSLEDLDWYLNMLSGKNRTGLQNVFTSTSLEGAKTAMATLLSKAHMDPVKKKRALNALYLNTFNSQGAEKGIDSLTRVVKFATNMQLKYDRLGVGHLANRYNS